MDRRAEPGETSEQSFDETLRELQGIVERLERGELPLEESLRAFERGVELSRRGQGILDSAERRVEILLRDGRTEPLALHTAEGEGKSGRG